MSEQHTPGRLKLLPSSETTIYTDDEHEMFVASCGTGEKQRNRETKANARRLAALWNLLVDVPTKEIEAAANYGASWGKTGLELAALTAELDALRTENARLLAELEAVGAGGVQPLRAEPATPQKPELRVGQVWQTRGGDVAEVAGQKAGLPYPFRVSSLGRTWTGDKDGKRFTEFESEADLIELISDVRKGGVA